ncbi:MAG: type IV secretion system DNA-binding domain-containing protein, partial [Gammaproteobacteria bacterium]|nr:type IV secretion system DNA-binding domain-containing protein [Gammaproteobacteria bacterium]
CLLRVYPKETPADLRDAYRTLVTDADGDSVAGQILSADLEIPFFADQLKRTQFSWLIIGATLWCSVHYGWFIPACILGAWLIIERLADGPLRARSVLAAEASSECASEYLADTASRGYFKQQEQARKQQIENAVRDNTPFLHLGTTTGLLYERRDPLAPSEANLPFGLSINDLSTHLLIFGATGTGKTSGIIRPLIRQWIEHRAGGLLVLDGKGELPKEVNDLNPDYVLISPEADAYNPIENLDPDEVADSFHAVFAGHATDPFWDDSAMLMIRFAAVLLKHSNEPYTIHNLYKLCTSLDFQIKIANTVPENVQGARLLAIEYFTQELRSMPEKTRASIVGIVRTWMLSLIGNEKLANWISEPHGAQIEEVMHGKHMGLYLPESRYGKGGTLISILSLRRLYTAIKNRGDDWHEKNQQAVLLVADEIQNLVTRHELDILPIARSLGLYCCFATQNMDGLERALGKQDADQLVGNLSNMIALPCRTTSSDITVSKRIGKIWRSLPDTHASMADSYADIGRYVFNGGDKWSMATHKQRRQRPQSSRIASSTAQDAMQIIRRWSSSFLRMLGLGKNSTDPQSLAEFDNARINTVKIGTCDLINPDEINSLLSCPNTAIAQIIRGRVPRRDIIKLAPEYRSK